MTNTKYLNLNELRFALVFIFVFFLLQYAYSTSRGSIVEHIVIDVATVLPSAAILNFIAPGEQVVASGHRIISPHGSLSILNGCEGTETIFLLFSAIVAFKASWRHKLKGAVLGFLIVYLLNQGRIIVLFFAAQKNRQLFDLLHGYVAPTLIIVLGSLFFLWWTSHAQGNEQIRAV